MAILVDTNILVYCYDPRFPTKQRIACELLGREVGGDRLLLPHQAILEFVSATTKPRRDLGDRPLLSAETAHREAEELMLQFPVLYPGEQVLVTALRARSTLALSWFDAHLWAYAEVNGIHEILSEDFQHGRYYGSVRVTDPFLAVDGVHELPAMYDSAE